MISLVITPAILCFGIYQRSISKIHTTFPQLFKNSSQTTLITQHTFKPQHHLLDIPLHKRHKKQSSDTSINTFRQQPHSSTSIYIRNQSHSLIALYFFYYINYYATSANVHSPPFYCPVLNDLSTLPARLQNQLPSKFTHPTQCTPSNAT